MLRRLILAATVITMLLAINHPSSAQEKLRLAWAGFSPTNSPIWVIEEKKLLQKQGVTPEIIAINASPTVLQALLADPQRFEDLETGCRLSLGQADLEWLLQILNDIRVGNWILLGSPEERREVLNAKTAPHLWAMEMAGWFEMSLLEALGRA